LLANADIVIEGSRPRALAQLGISAEEIVDESPGLTWISITGYGRSGDAANWIAFGDDAGVSAGLSALLCEEGGRPIFCGDAIADPLTGLHAAVAALSHWRRGAGGLIAIALRDVVSHCIAFDRPRSTVERAAAWQAYLDERRIEPSPPVARIPTLLARPLGADTAAALREFGIAC
jgi:crotonobetainyl-CoA:carnitine CoA-transferase CaiB-like acyl-CoA transferase